jgi:hypothetical protein
MGYTITRRKKKETNPLSVAPENSTALRPSTRVRTYSCTIPDSICIKIAGVDDFPTDTGFLRRWRSIRTVAANSGQSWLFQISEHDQYIIVRFFNFQILFCFLKCHKAVRYYSEKLLIILCNMLCWTVYQ